MFLTTGKLQDIETSLHLLYDLVTDGLKKLDQKLFSEIKSEYLQNLYGKGISLNFRDDNGEFIAVIEGVENTGELVLRDKEGRQRKYSFKEVELI